jgi:hypothetical protein
VGKQKKKKAPNGAQPLSAFFFFLLSIVWDLVLGIWDFPRSGH